MNMKLWTGIALSICAAHVSTSAAAESATEKFAAGEPVTYADFDGRAFFAYANQENTKFGYLMRFDFSGSKPEVIQVAAASPMTCEIQNFARFKQTLKFTAYCNFPGNTLSGDLNKLSVNMYTSANTAPMKDAILIDQAWFSRANDWAKTSPDNNTTIFFNEVLKPQVLAGRSGPRPNPPAAAITAPPAPAPTATSPAPAAAIRPGAATTSGSPADRLQQLQRLLDQNLITRDEYLAKRREIVDGL